MPNRPVTLHYDTSTGFGPDPRQVKVLPGDSIKFKLSQATRNVHPGSRLRITIHDAQFVDHRVLQHGPGQDGSEELSVRVGNPPPGTVVISTYLCEGLDQNGVPIPGLVVDGASGGEIVFDTAGGTRG